jgi:hypothetical protein
MTVWRRGAPIALSQKGVLVLTGRLATSVIGALLAPLLLSAAITLPAAAQTPVAPASGEKVTGDNVVSRWTPEPGWRAQCVQWVARPETSYPGGPFPAPDSATCLLGPQDVAYLLNDVTVRRYYWHVEAAREVCDPADPYQCRNEEVWDPTAYFDTVAPPPPPRPKACSTQAADVMADDFIVPYAKKHYPGYYKTSPVTLNGDALGRSAVTLMVTVTAR